MEGRVVGVEERSLVGEQVELIEGVALGILEGFVEGESEGP